MNKRYNDLIKKGYGYTGISSRNAYDKESIIEKAEALKVMGNKAAIVQKTDISPRRGGGNDRHDYWTVLLLQSDEYIAHREAKRVQEKKEYRQRELRRMVEGLTIDEIMTMLKMKVEG